MTGDFAGGVRGGGFRRVGGGVVLYRLLKGEGDFNGGRGLSAGGGGALEEGLSAGAGVSLLTVCHFTPFYTRIIIMIFFE